MGTSKKIWFFKQLTRKYSYPDKIIFSLNYFIFLLLRVQYHKQVLLSICSCQSLSNMGVLFCESLLVSLKYCYVFILFFYPCVLEIWSLILKRRHWLIKWKVLWPGNQKIWVTWVLLLPVTLITLYLHLFFLGVDFFCVKWGSLLSLQNSVCS